MTNEIGEKGHPKRRSLPNSHNDSFTGIRLERSLVAQGFFRKHELFDELRPFLTGSRPTAWHGAARAKSKRRLSICEDCLDRTKVRPPRRLPPVFRAAKGVSHCAEHLLTRTQIKTDTLGSPSSARRGRLHGSHHYQRHPWAQVAPMAHRVHRHRAGS